MNQRWKIWSKQSLQNLTSCSIFLNLSIAADVSLEKTRSLSFLFDKRRPISFDIDAVSIHMLLRQGYMYICHLIPCARKVKKPWSKGYISAPCWSILMPSHTSWRLSHHQQLRHLPWPYHCLPSKLALPPAIRSKLWKSSMNFQRQKRDSFLFWRFLRQRDSLIKLLTFTTVTRYNHVNHVDQGEQEWRLDACVDSPPPVPRTVLASFRDCMMQINPAVP